MSLHVPPGPLVLPGRFRAAVFDMDGLLLDTEPLWHDAERELLERHGDRFTDADLDASHGRALADTAVAYAPAWACRRRPSSAEIGEIMLAHYVAGAPLHRGRAGAGRRPSTGRIATGRRVEHVRLRSSGGRSTPPGSARCGW